MRFEVAELLGAMTVVDVDIEQVVIGGWTGRDAAAVQHHIDELAEIGVPGPSETPLFYRVGRDLLTQGSVIQTVGAGGSGEVEAVVIGTESGMIVAAGSDHTDRDAESYSIPLSKQLCPKPVSAQAWRLEDVIAGWDNIALEADQDRGGVTVEYQRGPLSACRRPEDLIERYTNGGSLAVGTALFCGTIPVIGGIAGGDAFTMRLVDPGHGRTLQHSYKIDVLPIIT